LAGVFGAMAVGSTISDAASELEIEFVDGAGEAGDDSQ